MIEVLRRRSQEPNFHDDVIEWKHFPRYWPFVRGIHRSPVNSPHKGQWCGALMFSLICTRINGWINNGEAGDLRRYRAHYDVTVMPLHCHVFLDSLRMEGARISKAPGFVKLSRNNLCSALWGCSQEGMLESLPISRFTQTVRPLKWFVMVWNGSIFP